MAKISQRTFSQRLNEIEESVNLGTLDTTILGLMIFVIAIVLTLISLGFPKLLINQPYFFAGTLVFFVLLTPIVYFIYLYAYSIIIKDGRFRNKIFIITYVLGLMTFIGLIWIFLFIVWIYERRWITPAWLTEIITIILLIFSILYSILYISPRVKKYFQDNFKSLIEKRLKEIKKNKTRN